MNIEAIINNSRENNTNLEEDIINYYINNEGLVLGKQIIKNNIKEILKDNNLIDDYSAMILIENMIFRIDRNNIIEEMQDYDMNKDSFNELCHNIKSQKEKLINYLTSTEFFINNCYKLDSIIKSDVLLKALEKSLNDFLQTELLTDIERKKLVNSISKKVQEIMNDQEYIIKNMCTEINKNDIKELIADKLLEYHYKPEYEKQELIIEMLFHFIYEITIYNIKTLKFVLNYKNNKNKRTYK